MGAPRTEITERIFTGLCEIWATKSEIAHVFGCSEDTVERWCKRELGCSFADAYKIRAVRGKISLRRTQLKLSEKSPSMAIWLGKQYLGQTDKPGRKTEVGMLPELIDGLRKPVGEEKP